MAGNLAMMTSRTKKRTSKFWPVLWVGDQVLKKKYCMVRIPTKSPFAHFVTLLHQHTVRPSPVRHPERPRDTHPACAEPGTAASRTKPNPKNKKDLVKILPQRVWESDGRTFYTFWHLASRFLPFLAGTWAPALGNLFRPIWFSTSVVLTQKFCIYKHLRLRIIWGSRGICWYL